MFVVHWRSIAIELKWWSAFLAWNLLTPNNMVHDKIIHRKPKRKYGWKMQNAKCKWHVCASLFPLNKFLSHKWLTQPSIDGGTDWKQLPYEFISIHTYKFVWITLGFFSQCSSVMRYFNVKLPTPMQLHRVHINTLRQPKSIKSKWRWIYCNVIRICFVNLHEKWDTTRACVCAMAYPMQAERNERNLYISETQISVVYLIIDICIQTTELAISAWNLYVRRLNFIRHRCVRAFFILPCHIVKHIIQIMYRTHAHTHCTSHNHTYNKMRIQSRSVFGFGASARSFVPHTITIQFSRLSHCSHRDNFIEMEIFHNKIVCIIKTIDVNH